MTATALHVGKKAHLVWSPGFGRAIVTCLAAEILILVVCATVPAVRSTLDDAIAAVQFALLEGAHQLKWWSAIAMLASACCVVQLILSAASIGCSGLNTLLGPLRPAFLVATTLLQMSSWYVVVTQKPDQAPSVAVGTVVALGLSLSPEVLDMLQNHRRRLRKSPDGPRVTLKLQRLSCAVCEAKVCQVAEGLAPVGRCTVDIDRSEATLALVAGADMSAAISEAAAALSRAGYPLAIDGAAATTAVTDHAPADVCPTAANASTSSAVGVAMASSDTWLGGVLGGLLGSSCCALQLALNLLASLGLGWGSGCTGFNTVLGPLRTYTRALTASYFAIRWAGSTPGQRRTLLIATLLAAGLTYMPEALLLIGTTALAPPTEGAVRVQVPVGGMGCEACQHAVRAALTTSSGVLDARVHGTEASGIAELHVHPEWGFNLTELVARVGEVGFEVDHAAAALALERAARSTK